MMMMMMAMMMMIMVVVVVEVLIGSLSNYDDNHNNNFQKTIGLMIKSTALHVITLFRTFLWHPLHDYNMKPPNLTFYRGHGHTTMNFPSSFWTWIKSFKDSTLGKVTCIWHIERVQIGAIKFERTQIHCFNDGFTAIVVVLA